MTTQVAIWNSLGKSKKEKGGKIGGKGKRRWKSDTGGGRARYSAVKLTV